MVLGILEEEIHLRSLSFLQCLCLSFCPCHPVPLPQPRLSGCLSLKVFLDASVSLSVFCLSLFHSFCYVSLATLQGKEKIDTFISFGRFSSQSI